MPGDWSDDEEREPNPYQFTLPVEVWRDIIRGVRTPDIAVEAQTRLYGSVAIPSRFPEMEVRVAMRLAAAQGKDWDALLTPDLASLLVQARVAIEELREPTEAMVDVGDKAAIEYWPHDPPTADAGAAWRAMIDVALQNTDPTERL